MKIIKGFITFEGCEGVGKSTQVRLLCEYLKETGQDYVLTREPGGTPLAEEIRQLILTNEMSVFCEASLFAAARSEHIDRLILPQINCGKLVICDRYIDSSLAYQGYARGMGEEAVLSLNSYAITNCMPEAVIFLNMDPSKSWRKLKGKVVLNDRMEKEDEAFHSAVYQGFLNLKDKYDRFVEIIPSPDKAATNHDIIRALRQRGVIR